MYILIVKSDRYRIFFIMCSFSLPYVMRLYLASGWFEGRPVLRWSLEETYVLMMLCLEIKSVNKIKVLEQLKCSYHLKKTEIYFLKFYLCPYPYMIL
ncbi:hypothetical protein V461_06430 [Pantoea ananatis BRT98]|nr:hypothetical protein V461_06430 [Pantoea ananatis BRT98]